MDQSSASPAPRGLPSCLPSETFAHFYAREQQLMSIDAEIERKKNTALLAAERASATVLEARQAASSSSTAPVAPAAQPLNKASSLAVDAFNDAGAEAGARRQPAAQPLNRVSSLALDAFNDATKVADARRQQQAATETCAASAAPAQPATASSSAVLPSPVAATPAYGSSTSAFEPLLDETFNYGDARAHLAFHQSGADANALHSTVRFQKARIVAMQEELDTTLTSLNERNKENARLNAELKAAQEENRRLQRSLSNSDINLEKFRKLVGSAETKSDELEKENRDLKKQLDVTSSTCKKAETDVKSKEAKIVKLTEEMERFRSSAKELKTAERDREKGERKETDRLLHEIRKLERQRTELLAGFKKQAQLIDVLKKQKAHLEAARMVGFTEEEYIRVLELGQQMS